MKIKYLKKLFLEVLGLPFYLTSMLVKRNEDYMVFGEWHGQSYCDNSKYFFQYVSKNSSTKAVWITKNKEIISIVTGEGLNCEYYLSVKGIYYCLVSKYAFVTHGSSDINANLLGKCILINLTHGTPLKKIGVDAQYLRLGKLTNIFDKYFKKIIPSKKHFDIVFCADQKAKERFKSAYDYPLDIFAYGYPRWKGLYGDSSVLNNYSKKYDRIISYLPTLRFNNHRQLNPLSFDGFNYFCEYLEKKNYLLIIRPHPVMTFSNENIVSKNIVFVRNTDINDVNEVLKVTDVLISDYSSVIYDFEKTMKPIILLAPDAETYLDQDVGVYGDYYRDFSWPIINDWFDVVDKIEEINFNCKYDNNFLDTDMVSERILNLIERL